MQGKDPYLALLGLFILGTVFFFCGEGSVTPPPPVALETPAEMLPTAPKLIELPPSTPSLPSVSAPGRAAMMSGNWTCWFWTVVGAGFLGWGIKGMVLGPVMDEKRREVARLISKVTMLTNQLPEVRTVEKRVEVPVERVVLKRVEVPVEKIVEKLVEVPIEKTVEKVVERQIDNPEQLARIKVLEGEVAVIVGLLTQIAQLQTVSSQAGGRGIEGRMVVPVDNPEQLARIKALEGEVAVIDDLRAQIAQLQALSSRDREKVVEKRIETPVEKIVVQNRAVPVETISEQAGDLGHVGAVEPSDEGPSDKESPDDLKHIRGVGPALERFLHKRGVFWFSQVATWSQADIDKFEFLLPNFGGRIQRENWVRSAQVEHYKKYKQWLGDGEPPSESPDLHAQIDQLQAASSQAGETVIETKSETSAEQMVVQNGDVPVETISEQAGDLTPAGAVEPSDEAQVGRESPDDLKHIRGVGPALERFLHKRGVFWFSQVATWSQADIDKFEFLLPNFGGRIQRESWVRSARVEHYKKYKVWLGDGEPPSESPDVCAQSVELQAASSQAGEGVVETRGETSVETTEAVPIDQVSEQAVDLTHAGAAEESDEAQVGRESPDDLKHIRGVGPALERFLHKRGVFWFSQVATWSQADIDKFEFLLPNFSGRIQRENWVRSAQVEYYKKYKKWPGDGELPSTTPDIS